MDKLKQTAIDAAAPLKFPTCQLKRVGSRDGLASSYPSQTGSLDCEDMLEDEWSHLSADNASTFYTARKGRMFPERGYLVCGDT